MVEFKFTVQNSGPLYLFLPTGYERTFTLLVNEEHYVTNNDYSRIVSLGYREAGDEMKLTFRLDEGKLYFFKDTDYLYTLDMNAFENAFDELSRTSLATDKKSTDDRIIGSISTYEDNKTIMTTIPYDKGWRVYVDGERVETYSVYSDVLMAFDIENAGEHEIEMRYMPDLYVITGIISIISFVIFALMIVIDVKRKKKPLISTVEVVTNEESTEIIEETQEIPEATEGEN